ncbi:MAG: benenodin family lasso peptide [Sphingomonas sp.]|jgi:hypothetical protein
MNPETNETIDLIDLGAASVETQGQGFTVLDAVGLQPIAGLSDED